MTSPPFLTCAHRTRFSSALKQLLNSGSVSVQKFGVCACAMPAPGSSCTLTIIAPSRAAQAHKLCILFSFVIALLVYASRLSLRRVRVETVRQSSLLSRLLLAVSFPATRLSHQQ